MSDELARMHAERVDQMHALNARSIAESTATFEANLAHALSTSGEVKP